jgi:hypothetical protein
MKMTRKWFVAAILLGLSVLAGQAAAYNITMRPGFNFIANHLNRGGNTVNEIMPDVPAGTIPDGTVFSKFDNASGTYIVETFDPFGGGWVPGTTVLNPGEGGALLNPSPVPFTLTFTGNPIAPSLPVTIPPGRIYLLSRQVIGLGTYDNIIGCVPPAGASLYRWNPLGFFDVYDFFPPWLPGVPLIDIGESVFIVGPTCEIPPSPDLKWLQPPGYIVYADSSAEEPDMHGGNRPSDVDWVTLMQPGGPAPPNWVIADDFISDGRPILGIRWWGSYFPGFFHGFEDGYVLSFFSDVPAQPGPAGSFSRPGDLLGTYVAPFTAVRAVFTGLVGWDGHFIWEYEVKLADTCLEHAAANVATRTAFLRKAIRFTGWRSQRRSGIQIFPVHDTNGVIIDWGQTNSNKRATNHFLGMAHQSSQRVGQLRHGAPAHAGPGVDLPGSGLGTEPDFSYGAGPGLWPADWTSGCARSGHHQRLPIEWGERGYPDHHGPRFRGQP